MNKSIIEIARQVGIRAEHTSDFFSSTVSTLEAFATAIKAAHLAELTQGVEMPEPVGYLPAYEIERLSSGHDGRVRSARFGPSALDGDIPIVTLDQCQQAVASAVARKDAENKKLVDALNGASQQIKTERRLSFRAERDALTAELAQRDKHLIEYNTRIDAEMMKLLNEKDALTAERDALAKDAARYRWLISDKREFDDMEFTNVGAINAIMVVERVGMMSALNPSEYDAVIDKAMKK